MSIYAMKSFFGPNIMMLIIGIFISLLGIHKFFRMYHSLYIFIEQNSIKIVKKALFGKNIKIYNPGELERVDFLYKYSYEIDNEGEGFYNHRYHLIFVSKKGEVNEVFSIGSGRKIFTQEEMDYFLYYMNNHIQTKMNVSELN